MSTIVTYDWIRYADYQTTRAWLEARGASTSWNSECFNCMDEGVDVYPGDYIVHLGGGRVRGLEGSTTDWLRFAHISEDARRG